jgi:hypothetical protein
MQLRTVKKPKQKDFDFGMINPDAQTAKKGNSNKDITERDGNNSSNEV